MNGRLQWPFFCWLIVIKIINKGLKNNNNNKNLVTPLPEHPIAKL